VVYINKAYASGSTVYKDLYLLLFSKCLNFAKYIKGVVLCISARRA